MSHHADYPLDPRLDITDVYCFTGTLGTVIHPSTVFVMNVAPLQSRGWNPDGYYEFRVDTTSPLDYIEDITWRVTFAADAAGVQHVRIEQLVGQAASDRNATGQVITPDEASLEQVITCSNGITFFAGERADPFFNDAFPCPPAWGEDRPVGGRLTKELWAPGPAHIGNNWMVFYAMRVSTNPDRFCIGRAASSTGPLGPYVDNSAGPFV